MARARTQVYTSIKPLQRQRSGLTRTVLQYMPTPQKVVQCSTTVCFELLLPQHDHPNHPRPSPPKSHPDIVACIQRSLCPRRQSISMARGLQKCGEGADRTHQRGGFPLVLD